MPQIKVAAGQAVADDIRAVFVSTDDTIYNAACLIVDFMDAVRGADLPPVQTQKALKSVKESIEKAVESRGHMIQAHRMMTVIKDNSNLAPVGFGCWFAADENSPTAEVAGGLTLVA